MCIIGEKNQAQPLNSIFKIKRIFFNHNVRTFTNIAFITFATSLLNAARISRYYLTHNTKITFKSTRSRDSHASIQLFVGDHA